MFQKIGVEMPDQVFQEVWQEAERRDPHREVGIISDAHLPTQGGRTVQNVQ